MQRILAVLLLVLGHISVACAQALQSEGWQWLEIEISDIPSYATRRAEALRIEFPQAAAIRTTTGYAVVVGYLRSSIAERIANDLTKDNFIPIRLNSGAYYWNILYGVDPFVQNKVYSLGFPQAPIANTNAPYIQIASRISFTQAVRIAKQLADIGSETAVMLTKNGWYSVVIERDANNRLIINALKSNNRIPSDSVLVNGQAFDEVIWKSSGPLDQRLVAAYPALAYSTPRAALDAGYGKAALELLENEYQKNGTADYVMAYNILSWGLGNVRQDPSAAFIWLSRCSKENATKCAYQLGLAYDVGFGVAKDPKRAVAYYSQCAELLIAACQKRLGIKKLLGEDTIQDFAEGAKLLESAAVTGDADAALTLGVTLMAGMAGRPQPLKAYFWLTLASNNLPTGKDKEDAVKFRNDIVKTLSGDVLIEIQNAAKQWTPGQPAPSFLELPSTAKKQDGQSKPGEVKSTGTGFYVNSSGDIVTNAHVVDECKNLKVFDSGKAEFSAKLNARDTLNDLAVIHGGSITQNYFKLRTGGRLGEPISAFGFPLSGVLTTGGNFTTGNITALAGLKDDSRHFQISAPVQPGNSGGPMLDDAGNVLGVVVGKANAIAIAAAIKDIPQNVNFSIKSSVLLEFLKTYAIPFDDKPSAAAKSTADIAELAKNGSVFIECVN
jgi:S1-C subfamily serine protease